MEQESEVEELKRKIMTLEWDKKQRQLNFSKNDLLEEYKKQLSNIQQDKSENG